MKKIILFENEHNKLCEKISEVKKLIIDRIKYERDMSSQYNVHDIVNAIKSKSLKDEGNLILYSKWEVRKQFFSFLTSHYISHSIL